MKTAFTLVAFSLFLGACAGPISGVITSEERRIWIVRDKTEIYRCADTAPDNEPPRPMCVRVPFTAGTSP